MGANSSTSLRLNNGTTLEITGSSVIKKRPHKDDPETEHSAKYNVIVRFDDGSEDEFDLVIARHLNAIDVRLDSIRKTHEVICVVNSDGIFEVTVNHTKEQLEQLDEKAQKINDTASELLQKEPSNYLKALEKCQEALVLANTVHVRRITMRNVARSLGYWGQELLNECFQLEPEEAVPKVLEAREKLLEAVSNDPLHEYKQNLRAVDLLVEGNGIYQRARTMEKEAFKELMGARTVQDDLQVRDRYSKVLDTYKEAQKKFQQGLREDPRFEKSLTRVKNNIELVDKIVEDMERTIMEKSNDRKKQEQNVL